MQDQGKVCDLFDARTTYLTLCQTHNLQFDTLRRAKHSSMMTLFHLHNPDHPAYPTSCASCQGDVQPGTGYKCERCPDYELCGNCYAAGAHRQHPHPVVVRACLIASCTVPLQLRFDLCLLAVAPDATHMHAYLDHMIWQA